MLPIRDPFAQLQSCLNDNDGLGVGAVPVDCRAFTNSWYSVIHAVNVLVNNATASVPTNCTTLQYSHASDNAAVPATCASLDSSTCTVITCHSIVSTDSGESDNERRAKCEWHAIDYWLILSKQVCDNVCY